MNPFKNLFSRWWLWLAIISWCLLCVVLSPDQGRELRQYWGNEQKLVISDRYANSQYIKGEAGEMISDSEVYIYSGIAYLQGEDPTTVNFEHPPLGKYVYGLSLLLFNNPFWINLIIFAIALAIFANIGKTLKLNKFLILLGQGLLTLTVAKMALLTAALLDLQLLVWTLAFFALILSKSKDNLTKYLLIGLCLGGIAATKFPFPNLFPYLLIFGLWILSKGIKKNLMNLLFVALSAGFVYFMSYLAYFINGHNLVEWFNFEKYRWSWWFGARPMRAYLIWQTLFLGKFVEFWSGSSGWHIDEGWNLSIPILFVVSTISQVLAYCKRKVNSEMVLLGVFNLAFLGIFSLGSGYAIRYLIIIYPIWYFLAIISLQKIKKGAILPFVNK